MGTSMVAIKPRGRFELFNRSDLYDMYVDTRSTGSLTNSAITDRHNPIDTRIFNETGGLEECCPIALIDVDMVGNCVLLGYLTCTTLTPDVEPDEDTPDSDDDDVPDEDEGDQDAGGPGLVDAHDHDHDHDHAHEHDHEHEDVPEHSNEHEHEGNGPEAEEEENDDE